MLCLSKHPQIPLWVEGAGLGAGNEGRPVFQQLLGWWGRPRPAWSRSSDSTGWWKWAGCVLVRGEGDYKDEGDPHRQISDWPGATAPTHSAERKTKAKQGKEGFARSTG